MNWYHALSPLEITFISLFGLLYLAYTVRMVVIARKLKNNLPRLFFKFFLRACYFTLFILALLGPSFGDIKKEVKSVGRDIYFAVDLSLSMNSEDVSPSRLEKVKYELRKLINQLPSDRIGFIIFSSSAVLHSPLTYDRQALNLYIEALSTNLLSHSGTDLEAPIKLGLEKLLSKNNSYDKNNSKVIVLVTDGEDFSSNAITSVNELRKTGVSLFVLGVGSNQGAPIPYKGGIKKDSMGNSVITKLNRPYLQLLASKAGGKYFQISQKQNQTEYLLSAIKEVEGSIKGSKKIDVSGNKYFYFLLAGLLLIVMDILLTIKTIQL